jgi:hypothetical protein
MPNAKLYRTIVVIAAAMLVFSASCSKKEAAFDKAPFGANPALIDSAVVVAAVNLAVTPPSGWRILDSTRLDLFRRGMGGTDLAREFYPVLPIVAFSDSATGCFAYIAQIDESTAPMSEIDGRYQDFLKTRTKNLTVTKEQYLVNDLRIYYYMLQSAQGVNYKLLGESSSGKRFLIEYVIRGSAFAAISPAVSASMAALRTAGRP